MQTHAAALAQGLHDRGHAVAVATYARPSDPDAAAAYDAARPFPTHRCLSRISFWANLARIADLAREFAPDLIYASTPFYGLLSSPLPVVCRSVGTDVMRCWIPYPFKVGSDLLAHPILEAQLYGLYRRLRAPAWLDGFLIDQRRRLVREAARSATRILANSEFTRDRLLEAGVDPVAIRVVAGGVDAARFARPEGGGARARMDLPGADPVLLTVCRLVAKKGLDVLIRAVALARRNLPGIGLVVVGDGPERSTAEALVAGLGLSGAIRFVGRVPHEAVAGYYHAADCFVLASRVQDRPGGRSDVETMGRVLCEAQAAGLPVVASRTGGVPTLIADGRDGLLVPPDDSAALAAAIVRLWRSPGLQEHLRRGGLRRAREEWDWSRVLDAYERVFAGLVDPAGRASARRAEVGPEAGR